MKRRHAPYRRAPAFTLAQNGRLRAILRELCVTLGTQRAASDLLGLRDHHVVNQVLAGGLAPMRLAVALAKHRGTTVEALIGARA